MFCLADFFCIAAKIICTQVVCKLCKSFRNNVVIPVIEVCTNKWKCYSYFILFEVALKSLIE